MTLKKIKAAGEAAVVCRAAVESMQNSMDLEYHRLNGDTGDRTDMNWQMASLSHVFDGSI